MTGYVRITELDETDTRRCVRRVVDMHGQTRLLSARMVGDLSSDDSYGDCVIRGHDWADGRYQHLEIIQANPRILISGELIDDIAIGTHPAATLKGNVLTIRGSNRTVVYRIVGHHPDRLNHLDTYVAEWPD